MPITHKGKQCKIKLESGTSVVYTLYPISYVSKCLSEALGSTKSTQTIRKWEEAKIIPPCILRVRNVRLYHQEQIDLLCRIAKEENIRQGKSFTESTFRERMWAEMTELNNRLLGRTKA